MPDNVPRTGLHKAQTHVSQLELDALDNYAQAKGISRASAMREMLTDRLKAEGLLYVPPVRVLERVIGGDNP